MKIKSNSKIRNPEPFRRAFTLVEMMLVVTIIGILAALVIPKIAGRSEQARVTAAYADITAASNPRSTSYEVDNGFYPKSLQDLIQQPGNAKNWHGPYFDPPVLPVDPWGNPTSIIIPANTTPIRLRPAVGRPGRQGRNGR
jgi:general secretion pathway protein G